MISICEQETDNRHTIGWITLDLPQTLNALTLDIATTAYKQLLAWEARSDIACVVLQGAGRAFCAGGDVRRMRQGILEGDSYCEQFFEQEYRLDHALHNFSKPLLVWGHGVVMGGGLGLLMGASHRVVTNSTRLAMPEISIGLYPDVGASVFLNQLPPGLGLFLGITGCEWNGTDALALGMANFLLDDACKAELPELLAKIAWSDDHTGNRERLTLGLKQLPSTTMQPQLTRYTDLIASVCKGSLQQAVTGLQALNIDEVWFERALINLTHGCPVTACIVEAQLRQGQGLSLADAFRMEWIISVQCCRHPDFPEGVRAQLIDKDRKPHWQFAAIADVPAYYVREHFTLSGTENPLQDLR